MLQPDNHWPESCSLRVMFIVIVPLRQRQTSTAAGDPTSSIDHCPNHSFNLSHSAADVTCQNFDVQCSKACMRVCVRHDKGTLLPGYSVLLAATVHSFRNGVVPCVQYVMQLVSGFDTLVILLYISNDAAVCMAH